jgi:hypothetical protein
VGHGDDRAGVFVEMALEPRHRLGVEMVRRLVEEEQVGTLQQQPAQCDAAPLAAREVGDRRVLGGQAQGVHRHLERAVEVPGVGRLERVLDLAVLLHDLVHRLGGHLSPSFKLSSS